MLSLCLSGLPHSYCIKMVSWWYYLLSVNLFHPMMLASFCSLTKTHLQWLHRKTNRIWPIVFTSINERRHDRTPAYRINVQSLMASVGESQVVDSTPVWHLSISESVVVSSIITLWCWNGSWLYHNSLSQVSSSSFSRTVPRRTGRLRQLFLILTVPNVEQLKKFFQNKLSSTFVITRTHQEMR